MSSVIQSSHNVTNLAPSATETWSHGLHNSAGNGYTPNAIMPTSATSIVVVSATATQVTVRNDGAATASALFVCQYDHSIQQAALTPPVNRWWAGIGSTAEAGNIVVPEMPDIFYPYTPTEYLIYVRPTGSDTTGDGSLANPYATLPRALQAVPGIIWPGTCYTIDMTGMGVVNLPADVYFPPLMGEELIVYDWAGATWSSGKAALNIRAEPTVLDTIEAADVTGQTADATSGIRTIQTTKTWVPNAYQGAILTHPAGTIKMSGIASNTATDIEVCDAYPITFPAQIVQPSCELVAHNHFCLLARNMGCSFGLHCIKLSSAGLGAAFLEACNLVSFRGCVIDGAIVAQMNWNVWLEGCSLLNTDAQDTSWEANWSLYLRACYANALKFDCQQSYGNFEPRECIFDGCEPIGQSDYDTGIRAGGTYLYRCEVRNATGVGIWLGGGVSQLYNVVVDSAVGHGVEFNQGNYHIRKVTGTANGGIGIDIENGAHVLHDDVTTTVTGAGGDYKVGGNAAAAGGGAGWAAFFAGGTDENDLAAGTPELCRMAAQ